jgi:hypothetical protein
VDGNFGIKMACPQLTAILPQTNGNEQHIKEKIMISASPAMSSRCHKEICIFY